MATKTVNLIERTEIKSAGVVLYSFQSETRDYTYYVTVKNGKIDTGTHQDCPGFHRHEHCLHIDHIKATEKTPQQTSELSYCQCCGKLSKREVCYYCLVGA